MTVLPAIALAWTVLASAALADAETAAEVDLQGDWYVLIHYRDSAEGGADVQHWDDRIWRFERQGSRLRWTEYPLAIFEDKAGRFESVDEHRMARSQRFWTPSDQQREEIREGLATRSEASRTKSLRGSDSRGYESTGGLRASSASAIGYSEQWRIDDPKGLPSFTQSASMSSARSDTLEGVTSYRVTKVEEDGALLVGRFQRDEHRSGEFRMLRTGTARIEK